VSKHIIRTIPVLALFLLAGAQLASAQGVSAYFGVGSASDGAATTPGCAPKNIIDPIANSCTPAPNIGGVFGMFGADFMITPHLGVNGEYSFRFAQAAYLPTEGLNVRPAFYDFNAVYEPMTGEGRVVPVLEGGIGGSKSSLYFNQSSCITQFCTNSSQVVATSNHFQLHGAVGVKLYLKSDMFIKPQIDFRWVNHLNQQYASDFVPQYTISIGYTFGRH